MRQTFQYLNELLKQLAVLKPVNPVVYSLPGVGRPEEPQLRRVVHRLPPQADQRP